MKNKGETNGRHIDRFVFWWAYIDCSGDNQANNRSR